MNAQGSSRPSGLSRNQLLGLWSSLRTCTTDFVNTLGLRRRRNCKAGHSKAIGPRRLCKQSLPIESAVHSACLHSPLPDRRCAFRHPRWTPVIRRIACDSICDSLYSADGSSQLVTKSKPLTLYVFNAASIGKPNAIEQLGAELIR